jgi:hypothetical protein
MLTSEKKISRNLRKKFVLIHENYLEDAINVRDYKLAQSLEGHTHTHLLLSFDG